MKRYLIIGALLVSAITSHAQTGGGVDSFFHANYNLPNLTQYANRQVGQVSYVLVSRNEYEDVEQRYTNGGYVKLGESRWSSISGIPSRDEAITYARFIGADAVVYAIMTNGHLDAQTGEERSDHTVGFYARPGGTRLSYTQQSGSVDFDSAERRL